MLTGVVAAAVAVLATPQAPAQGVRPITYVRTHPPGTFFYSPSGKNLYVPYTYTYSPTTNYYFAPSYSLPSGSYGGGFYPPASSYTSFLPSTAYSDYSATLFSSNPAQTGRVEMHDNWFSPRRMIVRPGTTVRWVNFGDGTHSTTSDDGLWDSGDLAPGGSFSATFHRQGTYHYRSRTNKREMQGEIVVQ
jgi:plastocyanin